MLASGQLTTPVKSQAQMDASNELPYWLALRRAGLGTTNFALLLRQFETIERAWHAPSEEIARAGIDAQFVRAVAQARSRFDPDGELKALERHGIRACTWLHDDYPASLRNISQSPPVLFLHGSSGPEFEQAVAIVGTRQVTPYGRQACEHFSGALAGAGVAIISGLARGVDAIAHRVAVEHGSPTVAVLAGGLDNVFPKENVGLAERIVQNGCLVSEYPVGIPARRDYFPRRNRILAGLAKATLVIEAGEGSGALHTANWAFDQGRDVFAVPGSIFSRQSWGTNQLIRENTAKLIATPDQLLEELNLVAAGGQMLLEAPVPAPAPRATIAPTSEEAILLKAIGEEGTHIDEVVRASGLPIAAVSSTLQIMELKGLVRQSGPMMYSKS